jgi:hypothetical protein
MQGVRGTAHQGECRVRRSRRTRASA